MLLFLIFYLFKKKDFKKICLFVVLNALVKYEMKNSVHLFSQIVQSICRKKRFHIVGFIYESQPTAWKKLPDASDLYSYY